jgi:hypothetical protein
MWLEPPTHPVYPWSEPSHPMPCVRVSPYPSFGCRRVPRGDCAGVAEPTPVCGRSPGHPRVRDGLCKRHCEHVGLCVEQKGAGCATGRVGLDGWNDAAARELLDSPVPRTLIAYMYACPFMHASLNCMHGEVRGACGMVPCLLFSVFAWYSSWTFCCPGACAPSGSPPTAPCWCVAL